MATINQTGMLATTLVGGGTVATTMVGRVIQRQLMATAMVGIHRTTTGIMVTVTTTVMVDGDIQHITMEDLIMETTGDRTDGIQVAHGEVTLLVEEALLLLLTHKIDLDKP
jgi:hypothetical protein